MKNHTSLTKLAIYVTLFISLALFLLQDLFHPSFLTCAPDPKDRGSSPLLLETTHLLEANRSDRGEAQNRTENPIPVSVEQRTELRHVVFGIAASARLWERRKNYIKVWWRPNEMRGSVWLDRQVQNDTSDRGSLPVLRISGDTSAFPYNNRVGDRSAIRISRIVSETFRLVSPEDEVRWFVMGDDDTVFFPDNVVRMLDKYDHKQMYYVGTSSETHAQNIYFSYNMAYGGGGFAVSYPLAKALEQMQDRCIQRYPGLYGSDDRIKACMAELGVPLTKEVGFHQFDLYGNIYGLLAAHPVAPLLSVHHLDLIDPIFPAMNRVEALEKLQQLVKLDHAALLQQSICYDFSRSWTVSVSWGYTVQVVPGMVSVREMELPIATFVNWHRRFDPHGFSFNTRPVNRNPCRGGAFVYFYANASFSTSTNWTTTEYTLHNDRDPICKTKADDPSRIQKITIYKKPDPFIWDKAPRRNCCRILPSIDNETMVIDVGPCEEGETIEIR